MAEEVLRLAQSLLNGELHGEELPVLLERSAAIRREIDIYTAAAVQDARHRGEKWEAVAKAAHIAPETARARWGPERVARLMSVHSGEKRLAPARRHARLVLLGEETPQADGQGREEDPNAPAAQLASALTALLAQRGMAIKEVASQTMLSASFISRVLSGERLPSWGLVCSLADIFQSDPAELWLLYRAACGVTAPARQPATEAISQLHAALRGLHLAAKSPTAEQVEALSSRTVSAAAVRRALSGLDIPEWEVTAALVGALGGRPSDFKPLWEAVHYTFLMCDDPRQPDGTSHAVTPEEEP